MLLLFLLSVTDTPPDFWHDSAVQFAINVIIALVVGVGTALIAISIFRKQQRQAQEERTVKELMYEVVSDAPIANINKAVADRVEIRYDGQPVSNMFLLILRIVNTGNIAVKPDDYAEPLEVIFKERKVISSDILETSPKNLISESSLKSFFQIGDTSMKLAPILLNPNESINIKILLAGDQSYPELRARIADGYIITAAEMLKRQNTMLEQKKRRSRLNRLILASTIFLIYISIVFIIGIISKSFHSTIDTIAFLVASISIMAIIASFVNVIISVRELSKIRKRRRH